MQAALVVTPREIRPCVPHATGPPEVPRGAAASSVPDDVGHGHVDLAGAGPLGHGHCVVVRPELPRPRSVLPIVDELASLVEAHVLDPLPAPNTPVTTPAPGPPSPPACAQAEGSGSPSGEGEGGVAPLGQHF